MRGKVESGQLVTLDPVAVCDLKIGDIVLCRVKGNVYLHLVKAKQEGRVQIGNNRCGKPRSWLGAQHDVMHMITTHPPPTPTPAAPSTTWSACRDTA